MEFQFLEPQGKIKICYEISCIKLHTSALGGEDAEEMRAQKIRIPP